MFKAIVSDFSGVILEPVDENYTGSLNELNKKLSTEGDYDFWKYFKLNEELLDFYKSIKNRIDIYVFTTGYIQEHPSLQPKLEGIFKNIFSSDRLGLKKKDKDAYKTILERTGFKPEEILYLDDKKENVDIASGLGVTSIHYKSNYQAIGEVKNVLSK